MANSGYALKKISEVFEYMENCTNIITWFIYIDFETDANMFTKSIFPDFINGYRSLTDKIYNNIIIDRSGDILRAANYSDAYYGDAGVIADMFKDTKKPVMYQNYEVKIKN